ncbi:DUF6273 domain-containing protein [Thermophilibacter sp. ET337]|uniref:DUF6273 domain-containing protein n=1 Tax=Thermophilibacter sp. ET337 TaxID=2973084 RepID=UPI0035CAB082
MPCGRSRLAGERPDAEARSGGCGSATNWWLRSVNSSTNFRNVNTDGSLNNNNASNANGVCP